MKTFDIYQDIAARTDGDIYIGVVGPVRTGKSTFIKNFMDMLVLPNIDDANVKERTKDELPQSSSGRTIMTTEPKFIPNEAVAVNLDNNVEFNVKMIDCVGYMVPGATGHTENDQERLVRTPWFEEEIPFTQAAEIGTRRVIKEHSTVGIVVTSDGSITDINRDEYIEAEERVIDELKKINKPFVLLLNSSSPYSEHAKNLKDELSRKYEVPVMTVNCQQLKLDDINNVFDNLLREFPLKELKINLPRWIETLDNTHWLKSEILNVVKQSIVSMTKLRDIESCVDFYNECEYIKKVNLDKIDLSSGSTNLDISMRDNLFYDVLSETTGIAINNEYQLVSIMKKLATAKNEYDKVAFALNEVRQKGYGVVNPILEEISLDQPEIVKQGNKYGVKLKASAPSIHLIRADIETEVAPIVGTESQSEQLISTLLSDYETDPQKLWQSNILGKSLQDLVNEGLQNKLFRMPEEAQTKLQETLQRIINEGSGGLICIIL